MGNNLPNTSSSQGEADASRVGQIQPEQRRLPRRDLLILPLIAFLTLVFLLAIGEGVARIAWSDHEQDACVLPNVPFGRHGKPNCTSTIKKAESDWITTHYNDCGFRSPRSCGPLPPGTPRVAVIGASTSGGYLVAEPDLFTTLAAERLTTACGRMVDFQNLGIGGLGQDEIVRRADEAMQTKPNVVVWVFVPFDIENVVLKTTGNANSSPPPAPSLFSKLHTMLLDSRAVVVAQHYFYRRLSLYIKIYLGQSDRAAFMRQPLSALWQARLNVFERNITAIAEKAKTAGARFLLVLTPQQAQAAIVATGAPVPPDVSPFALGQSLEAIASRHGVEFLDLTSRFKSVPWRNDFFYPVDGHLAAGGNRILADGLVAKLTDGEFPVFASCHPPGS